MVSYVEEGMLVRYSFHFHGEGNFPCKTKKDISKPKLSAYYQNHGNYSNLSWRKKEMAILKSSCKPKECYFPSKCVSFDIHNVKVKEYGM